MFNRSFLFSNRPSFFTNLHDLARRLFRSISSSTRPWSSSSILFQERSSVVSVCVKKCRWVNERDEERTRVTMLFLNASTRCCAPRSPIWFSPRSSVVSVCVKKCRWGYERDEERMRVTVLLRNASARCCAPRAPIWLCWRRSVVSVCVKKCRWVYERWRENEGHHVIS